MEKRCSVRREIAESAAENQGRVLETLVEVLRDTINKTKIRRRDIQEFEST